MKIRLMFFSTCAFLIAGKADVYADQYSVPAESMMEAFEKCGLHLSEKVCDDGMGGYSRCDATSDIKYFRGGNPVSDSVIEDFKRQRRATGYDKYSDLVVKGVFSWKCVMDHFRRPELFDVWTGKVSIRDSDGSFTSKRFGPCKPNRAQFEEDRGDIEHISRKPLRILRALELNKALEDIRCSDLCGNIRPVDLEQSRVNSGYFGCLSARLLVNTNNDPKNARAASAITRDDSDRCEEEARAISSLLGVSRRATKFTDALIKEVAKAQE